ncbi:PTS system beta-glucosides-specific IIC component [Gracilibacillus halotolerans]|uniref:PTS system beta-glucosides-specific IIC component n=1 Tax=Gracilibacillus halotolerans TaxID=74386 RepID=A0A841RLS1_9BACI|nr:beta-glucoside-specific PTS transporter subunit IIABC [Gracilibacillus halotolerans]MBB6513439.1 PTS system beta-glucosides-specific IIC component [Gracilibacillus halotolerans]
MSYEKLAKDIIENVGGEENVNSVVHCITRLRFKLKDEEKANTDVLKNMDGVVTVMQSGGQYQVVIGNHVPDVYKAVVAEGGFQSEKSVESDESSSEKKGNLFSRFVDIVSSIFTPILGVLAASGMIKGFNALFIALGWLSEDSGTYAILNIIGDALFYFLPVFLGYTAIKKFGGSPFIGMAIGSALVYPTVSELMAGEAQYTLFTGTLFESPVHVEFLGIPVILMSYASSVIPIILSAYFAAKVENGLKKVIPDVIRTFVVPFLTLLIIIPLTFLIIGPIATWAGQMVGSFTIWIYELSPIIAGIFLGGLWQVFVIFGLHWGLVPIAINNLMVIGRDPILALMFATTFAQTGAVLGVWLKTKQQKLKTLSIPAFISGLFGVTEPAIYGVTLPLKRPFIFSCIAAAVGSAIIGLFGTLGYTMGGLGIFQIPSMIHPEEGLNFAFWAAIVAMVVAFALAFLLTYFFGAVNRQEQTTPVTDEVTQPNSEVEKAKVVTTNQNGEESIIQSPLTGLVIPLSEIKDAAFASGALGKGVAIEPTIGKVIAPVSGTVTALYPSNHAIGITSDQGAEVLIHVGMDTVQLGGKHFVSHTAQGERVEKGKLLIEFDIEAIKQEGYELTTPVVITNSDAFDMTIADTKEIESTENLLTLRAK